MTVEGTNNLSNFRMNSGGKNLVGVIDRVPDNTYAQTYYKPDNGRFAQLNYDVYTKLKKAPEPKHGEFPKILKILGGIAGLASVILFGKTIGKSLLKFVKNLAK